MPLSKRGVIVLVFEISQNREFDDVGTFRILQRTLDAYKNSVFLIVDSKKASGRLAEESMSKKSRYNEFSLQRIHFAGPLRFVITGFDCITKLIQTM